MGVKVFTATKAKEREMLGEAVTRWLADNPRARVPTRSSRRARTARFTACRSRCSIRPKRPEERPPGSGPEARPRAAPPRRARPGSERPPGCA